MVWKKYPRRLEEDDKTAKLALQIVEVCSCGHGAFNHTQEERVRGACEKCLCLLFEYQTSMSIKDLVDFDFRRRGIKI